MHRLFNIIAQTLPDESQAASAAPESPWYPVWVVLCTAGLCIFMSWLFWCGGFKNLRNAPTRRHRWWFVFWPLGILFFWNITLVLILNAIAGFKGLSPDSLPNSITYPVNGILEIGLIAGMLIIAHKAFSRRLKGFGLNIRMIHKDAGFAAAYLLAIYPLILFAILAVTLISQSVKSDFQPQEHQMLTHLAENSNTGLKIMMVVVAAGIVPVFEEMLFRGFLQSTLRSAAGPWTAIIVTSVFFALVHWPNYTHMPALFLLSCGFGYAYERSGSLFRPILMHALFNGINIAGTLLQSP